MDLAEFVSDYLKIEGSEKDSNHDIAMAFADATASPDMTDGEFDLLVHQLEPQIAYYRPAVAA